MNKDETENKINMEQSQDILTNKPLVAEKSPDQKPAEGFTMTIAEPDSSSTTHTFDTYEAYDHNGSKFCCFQCHSPDYICCVTSAWWTDKAIGYRWVKPSALVTSYFVPDIAVLIVRSVLVVWTTIVLIYGILVNFENGWFFFYFTNLSYMGLTAYFWMACGLSWHHYIYKHSIQGNLKRPATIFEIITGWLYCSSFTIHIIVPIVYWALLSTDWVWAEKSELDRWLNVSRHGLDLFVIFVEFFLNRIVYVWGHLVITYIVVLLYVFWAWIGTAIYQMGFPYFFLNYNKPVSFVYILGITLIFGLFWIAVFYLHYIKAYVGKRILKK